MIEQFEQGTLPSEDKWKEHIETLKKQIVPSTKEEVKQAILAAVEKRIPTKPFGLFLSGGVDSSLLALLLKQHTTNFICYSVGIKDSPDLAAAENVSKSLGLNLRSQEYEIEDLLPIFKKTANIVRNDAVSIGVGSVIFAAVDLAKKDDISIFFGGLGSEEIFAGYQRHANAKNINEECWNGLKQMWERDLTRDAALAAALTFSARVPFLDDNLIKAAMGISGEKKINGEHKKVILREIAEELGLPKEFAWRKKQAAQYGSGFDKALEKLAKKAKLSKSEFVAHLTCTSTTS